MIDYKDSKKGKKTNFRFDPLSNETSSLVYGIIEQYNVVLSIQGKCFCPKVFRTVRLHLEICRQQE